MGVIAILALCAAVVAAVPTNQRIVGGSVTTIEQYPSIVALLDSFDLINFTQGCGGTVLNNRSVLTAAHCVRANNMHRWRIRAGSTYANSGGTIYIIQEVFTHPEYNVAAFVDFDFSIVRSATVFAFSDKVRPVAIAGPNYNLEDNEPVYAAGWGFITEEGPSSEQLRHVQVYTINQMACRLRMYGSVITDNMLCTGILDVGGKDQCYMDSGGPVYHHGVLVGVCSFGMGCARPQYPGVNARVSSAANWIVANA
ncbi:trypsin, alkaline C-like [Helicoverpa zea]|uniref:trypsin, alkaline C-like n=1 Tax=Helicoverpa zea TaxID=7113 RepID=UPI001F58A1C9|nr:trypsin, alkaline C-like [Helicoverpa zea]